MEEVWHDSPKLFLEAIGAIEQKFPTHSASATLASALIAGIGLSAQSADVFSRMCEEALAHIREQESVPPAQGDIARAIEELNSLVKVNFCYDLDYLAGYAEDNPKKIYIDRGFSHSEVVSYLVVHEVVEKCLIDFVHFKEHTYAYAHQVAQRVEEVAVVAGGRSWLQYQKGIMEPEIERAGKTEPKVVPPDLDLTPHRETHDEQLPIIEKLKVSMPFTIEQPAERAYHLVFKDAREMARVMLRFQECYESPKFKGTIFTHEAFDAWYATEHPNSTYEDDWHFGFNLPIAALEPFYEGKFAPLKPGEELVLNALEPARGQNAYVIATARDAAAELVAHELAHALYYLNAGYKSQVEELLATVDLEPLKAFLLAHYGDYHPDVLFDECQAYLADGAAELRRDGFDVAPYAAVITKLQQLFKTYTVEL